MKYVLFVCPTNLDQNIFWLKSREFSSRRAAERKSNEYDKLTVVLPYADKTEVPAYID